MSYKELFRNYATSTAFSVSLSKEQIFILKKIRAYECSEKKIVGKYSFERFNAMGCRCNTLGALIRKGFIELTGDHYQLTPVGLTVLTLVDMAGLLPFAGY